MKRALAVVLLVAAIACGATVPGTPLNEYQLKFRIFDELGPPAFCDPDSYPVARAGRSHTFKDFSETMNFKPYQ